MLSESYPYVVSVSLRHWVTFGEITLAKKMIYIFASHAANRIIVTNNCFDEQFDLLICCTDEKVKLV